MNFSIFLFSLVALCTARNLGEELVLEEHLQAIFTAKMNQDKVTLEKLVKGSTESPDLDKFLNPIHPADHKKHSFVVNYAAPNFYLGIDGIVTFTEILSYATMSYVSRVRLVMSSNSPTGWVLTRAKKCTELYCRDVQF